MAHACRQCFWAVKFVILTIALLGCASQEGRLLKIGDALAEGRANVLWPSPPDIPRFRYQGQLLGDVNYQSDANNSTNWDNFWRRIAGLSTDGGDALTLQRPQAGVVDGNGRILITDASRAAVVVFALKGGVDFWEFASGFRRFVSPVGISVDAENNVFVADAEYAEIFVLSPAGKPIRSFGKGVLKRPTGITMDRDRRELFVVDTYSHDVKIFTLDGALIRTLGQRGDQRGQFNFPTHAHFARNELYVADTLNNRVQVFTRGSDNPRLVIGSLGSMKGQFARPKGVTTDSEGNIYVVESYFDHLVVFDAEGRFLLPIGGLGKNVGQFYLPSGVFADSRNRIFVADMFNGRVAVFQFLGGGAAGEY